MHKIAILGGGIGGLTLANVFQKLNIEYQLFESTPEFKEVGAGIGISESTIEIFKMLNLKEQLIENGFHVEKAIIVDKNLNEIKKIPTTNGGICIHRMNLINILAENLDPTNLKLGHKLLNFYKDDNKVSLTFANDKTYKFDTVISCDGINSIVRKKIFPSIKKRYSGQTIYRGIATCELPKKFNKNYYEFWGDNLRFAIISITKNEYYWYAVKCAKANEKSNPSTVKSELKALFKTYASEVSLVIEKSEKIIKDDMWDLPPEKRKWHHENIVFLGDAIHATTPNLAQGGCQAIEDAITLGRIIEKYGANEEAFILYKNLRQEKVNYIVKQSWKYGKLAHQSNIISEKLIISLFKRILPNRFFQNQYNRLIDLSYLKEI